LKAKFPDLDIMVPDHRGTGRSDRLSCPPAEQVDSDAGRFISDAELEGCVELLEQEWGAKLATFNGTQAALDIGELIELTREPEDEPFVYGISYGSQWGHRYLQAFPEQAAGVALEAICVPNCDFLDIEGWFEQLAERYFDACGQDALCSSKLGPDPWSAVALVETSLASCVGLDPRLDHDTFKTLGAQLLYGYDARKLLPVIVHRLNRCAPEDVSALNQMVGVLVDSLRPPLEIALNDSDLLGLNVALIDNFPFEPPPLEDVIGSYDEKLVALGASVRHRIAYDVWPPHPKDAYFGQYAEPAVPVLMIHGTLDFIPLARAESAADQLGSSLVVLPTAPHSASFQSPLAIGHCGARVLFEFFGDPTVPPDTSCVGDIVPLDFEISAETSTAVFGTSDAYDGAPGL
jgi:pimeloyl-ACP methyl ester carboxylesterase